MSYISNFSFFRTLSLLCVLVALVPAIHAQETENQEQVKSDKKEKKNKKNRNFWGGGDTNAIEKNLEIRDAFVTEGEEMLRGVTVSLLNNGVVIDSTMTDKWGGFSYTLQFDIRYLLRFSKAGYVTKSVEIDLLNMPDYAKKEGYDLGRFQMGMVRYVEGMETDQYDVPVARYYFDERTGIIQLDRTYVKKRKEIVAQQAAQNQEVIDDKQADEDALQEEYNTLIRDADIEFEARDYGLAKEYYMSALKIKPLAEYPRQQIEAINNLKDGGLDMEEKYTLLISQGDEAYKNKDYESAEKAYKSAIKIKTTDPYPRNQLKKIEQIRATMAANATAETKKSYSLKDVPISEEKKGFCSALAKKYPQGLTEEKYMEGSKTVTRRIIVDGNVGVEYKKIEHNWGGVYYFKNGKTISHFIWQKEAIQ